MKIQTVKFRYAVGKMFFLFFIPAVLLYSCEKKLNIFSIEDDINFGKEFDAQVLSSGEFVIVSESQHPQAYAYINGYKDKLLATGKVAYADKFEWKVRIIKDDATVNAFAVPGGYLYFYTGLINVLESEAEFVGVLAHEMAHVACRHSTQQMTDAYGIELLFSMLLGKSQNQWVQIASEMASGLTALKFSRNHEFEADKCAVQYAYPTDWDSRGVSYFFKRLESHSSTPVFLSTHPSDEKRIENVEKEWANLGGKEGNKFESAYNQFKASLP